MGRLHSPEIRAFTRIPFRAAALAALIPFLTGVFPFILNTILLLKGVLDGDAFYMASAGLAAVALTILIFDSYNPYEVSIRADSTLIVRSLIDRRVVAFDEIRSVSSPNFVRSRSWIVMETDRGRVSLSDVPPFRALISYLKKARLGLREIPDKAPSLWNRILAEPTFWMQFMTKISVVAFPFEVILASTYFVFYLDALRHPLVRPIWLESGYFPGVGGICMLIFLVLCFPIGLPLYTGRVSRFKRWAAIALGVIGIVGACGLWVPPLVLYVNEGFDFHPPVVRDVQAILVEKQQARKRSAEIRHVIYFRDWQPPFRAIRYSVGPEVFRTIHKGDRLDVLSGPGAFGIEWIREVRKSTR